MAKVIKTKASRKLEVIFPFEKINYIIIGVGLVVIIAGYIALSVPSVDGFVPLTLAPILLVLGYCVIIPIGILYRKKSKSSSRAAENVIKN